MSLTTFPPAPNPHDLQLQEKSLGQAQLQGPPRTKEVRPPDGRAMRESFSLHFYLHKAFTCTVVL